MGEQAKPRGARYTYGRTRRVRLRRDTESLFGGGEKCFEFPYRGIVRAYRAAPGASASCRLLAVVPKRVCKLAVERNAQKRRMRELFRVESAALHAECRRRGVQVDVALLLVHRETVPVARARRSVQKIIRYAEHQVAGVK